MWVCPNFPVIDVGKTLIFGVEKGSSWLAGAVFSTERSCVLIGIRAARV